LTAEDWTARATVALAVCALLQLVVLGLQWKTLAAQTAFQRTERARAGRQAFERARLVARLARRSLLETHQELDDLTGRVEETPHQKFAAMAVGLATVEEQLQRIHEYLTEATDSDLTAIGEAIGCFLRAADRVNRLSTAPERMGDTPPATQRLVALQDAREDVRRAIVHLEGAARLTPNHALSRAI